RVSCQLFFCFFFSSRRRHTRFSRDWSSDVCSSDLTIRLPKWNRVIEAHFDPCEIKTFRVPREASRPVVETNLLEWEGEGPQPARSEERRVGKERRPRWSRSDGRE